MWVVMDALNLEGTGYIQHGGKRYRADPHTKVKSSCQVVEYWYNLGPTQTCGMRHKQEGFLWKGYSEPL